MVRKRDGSIRVCVDYKSLNERDVKESFLLPRIDDLLDKLRTGKCMTHLDLPLVTKILHIPVLYRAYMGVRNRPGINRR
jgi:hypothetical protein